MAPAVSASILSATSAAAAGASKRPAASDAEPPALDSVLQQQGDDEAARKSQQQPKQQQLECPRCQSTNTKFCYYNNYSTAQPRHFCRACRRYWTHGGTLRDVPVGGASRRSGGGAKRRRVSAEASSSASPPPPPAAENAAPGLSEDACLPATGFPFLSDGSFLPHFDFDLGVVAPVAFSSWPSSSVPGFYDGLAPWDDTTVSGAGIVGQWGDIAGLGLDLGWAPPGN